MSHIAIKHPTTLYAEPIGMLSGRNEWVLVATDTDGNRIEIIATGERFRDALMGRNLRPMTRAEQVREMYVRDEVGIEVFERALEREMR